jgi:hypothetical protein
MSGVLHGVLAAIAGARDAFFRYVTLLLNTNATNGAQNNTFLDSSTNNFSITRNGDTTQGSFNPYMPTGYWSGYFDGNGDELNAGSNAAFSFGTGAYTVECWVFLTAAVSATHQPCFVFNDTTGGFGFWNENGLNQLNIGSRAGAVVLASTTTLTANTWNHIVAVRSGTGANQTSIFVNGLRVANGTDATNWTITGPLKVGGITTANYYLTGYQSNVRVVKGTAVYDPTLTTLTVPTTPLTAITNTSLLCLQDNRFKDNSTNAFAITVNGDSRISKFAPFNPPASYSTASYGGSGYFDGTGDYLSIADSATIRFGTGAFTIQGWVYRGAAGATHTIAAKGGASTGWVLQITSTNVLRFTDTTTNIDTTTTIPASTWAHVAVVRTSTGSNGLKLYINAVDSATGTSSTDFSQTDALNIGADRSNANAFNGYISNLKYTVGTAESISVPASPITGGTVLLNFTNAGIFDAATINDGQTVGNAQVSTTQAKWGTTSMYFDGAGDEAVTVAKANLVLGTAPFTVEMWVYCTNAASGATQDLVGNLTNVPGDTNWHFSISSTGVLQSGTYNNLLASSGAATLSSTTWTHVALTFDGTTYRVFINGTVGSTTSTVVRNLSDATSAIKVGNTNFGSRFFNGYIDDLRITRGVARYTSNFTAPTAAFPLQ